jgi:hypothetical protein
MRILLTFAVLSGIYGHTWAQSCSVAFEWQYINVIDGYDHQSKMVFYVNDTYYDESTVSKNSERNSYVIKLDEGIATISAQNWALYEGEWEEVLKENEYSLDANYIVTLQVEPHAQRTVVILFDIASEKVLTVSVH